MGPLKSDSTESLLRVERCSPRGAPRKPVGCAGEEPEEHKRLNKNAASTTIGTSMGQEICLSLGQVSLSSRY